MNQKGLFRIGFIEELKAQILEMRYTKGALSMFVLLPSCSADNVKGLEEVSLHFIVSTKYFTVNFWRAALLTTYLPEEGWHLSYQRYQRICKNLNSMREFVLIGLENAKSLR